MYISIHNVDRFILTYVTYFRLQKHILYFTNSWWQAVVLLPFTIIIVTAITVTVATSNIFVKLIAFMCRFCSKLNQRVIVNICLKITKYHMWDID